MRGINLRQERRATYPRGLIRIAVLMFLMAPVSWACLNDTVVNRAEGEFKGRYATSQPVVPATSGAGLVLVLSGVFGSSLALLILARRRGWM